MSYTPPTYVDTKSQAILALASVIADEDKTALGDGSVNRALDVLADVLAETDVSVPQTNAGAILALAQYADGMIKPEGTIDITENGEGIDVTQYATADVNVSGGGGGDTVELSIMEISGETMLSTAYFTVEDSNETQLTITPVSEGDFHWFTITANVGELLTFKPVNGSGYDFGDNTMYVMIESSETYPLSYSTTQVKIVAANDQNAVDPYLMLELTDIH